jgi:hypothetical protein
LEAFIVAIRNLVAFEVHIYFSAATQTGKHLVNIVWAFVAAIENPIFISLSRCLLLQHNTPLFAFLRHSSDEIGKTVAIRVFFCFSAATHREPICR